MERWKNAEISLDGYFVDREPTECDYVEASLLDGSTSARIAENGLERAIAIYGSNPLAWPTPMRSALRNLLSRYRVS